MTLNSITATIISGLLGLAIGALIVIILHPWDRKHDN